MADKKDAKKKDDKKKVVKHHSGGMSFGTEVILFMIALFIIWAIFNKPSTNTDKALIKASPTSTTSTTTRTR